MAHERSSSSEDRESDGGLAGIVEDAKAKLQPVTSSARGTVCVHAWTLLIQRGRRWRWRWGRWWRRRRRTLNSERVDRAEAPAACEHRARGSGGRMTVRLVNVEGRHSANHLNADGVVIGPLPVIGAG